MTRTSFVCGVLLASGASLLPGQGGQANGPEASMLINSAIGYVGIAQGDLIQVQIGGPPNRSVLLISGTEAPTPVQTAAGFFHLDQITGLLVDGTSNPLARTDASGRFSVTYQMPWLAVPGAQVSVQAAVEDPLSTLGFRLSAAAQIEVQFSSSFPAHLYFDPVQGAKGTENLLAPAGTLPGDLPTLGTAGFEGPTTVFDGKAPVHGVFQNPYYCYLCHGNVQEIWPTYMGTMMANAARDPMFLGAFSIAIAGFEHLEQHGLSPLGGELAADYCIRCHSTNAWYSGRSGFEGDGTYSAFRPAIYNEAHALDQEGVVCDTCHRTVGYEPNRSPSSGAIPGHPDNAQLILSPSTAKFGPFPGISETTYGSQTPYGALANPQTLAAPPVAHNPPVQEGSSNSPGHDTEYSDFTRKSELCGSCHNITHPLNGNAVERTYTEWLNSAYGRTNSPDHKRCQECHMPAVTNAMACTLGGGDPTYGDWNKVRGQIRKHEFVGGNAWIPQILKQRYPLVDTNWTTGNNYVGLSYYGPAGRDTVWDQVTASAIQKHREAASVDLVATEPVPGTISAQVKITNLTGHKLPTGYTEGRRMWIQIAAKDAQGTTIFQSGFLDANSELIHDPALKVYEAEHGLEYPQLGLLGPSFHFGLNNRPWKDNRILPKGGVQVKGMGGSDSYDPILAPFPTGGLYPDGQHWDTTNYTIPVSSSTPRPIRVTATVFYQTSSFAYVQFLANGGDNIVQTLPHPEAVALRDLWLQGFPAPAIPVGVVGATSVSDPTSPTPGQTALVIIP